MNFPLFARKFVVDFIETALALVFALNLVFPTDTGSLTQTGIIVGSAVLSALISALRRAIPGFLLWLNTKMGTGDDEGNA